MIELTEAKQIFSALFDGVSGRALSLAGREALNIKNKSYVYGEVKPDSYYEIIKEANPKEGGVFYDLGSGTGKALILTHLLFHFSKVKGIEYIPTLYESSKNILKRYNAEILPKIKDKIPENNITIALADFLTSDISDADFIFMNSTCFQADLIMALSQKLEQVKPGTQIISLSKSLQSPQFTIEKQQMYDFSWGRATVFFQRKIG